MSFWSGFSREETPFEAVRRQYKTDGLAIYMLPNPSDPVTTKEFLDVLACKEGARYTNMFKQVSAHPNGFCGLPATVAKEGYPVPLWSPFGRVGLSFDLHKREDLKIIYTNSCDNDSFAINGGLTLMGDELFPSLRKMQPGDLNKDGHIYYPANFIENHIDDLDGFARPALQQMWKEISAIGWDNYVGKASEMRRSYPGMNEINLWVRMQAVNGFVVYKSGYPESSNPEDEFKGDVILADSLAHQLQKSFPHLVREALPVMLYDPSLEKNALQEITHEQRQALTGRAR